MKIQYIRSEFKIHVVASKTTDTLHKSLIDANFNIKHFSTAKDILANLVKEPPHIIISQADLPEMPNLKFLISIKEMSDDILMIVITSDIATKEKFLQNGAYDCIDKEINKTCLINALDRAIEKLYLQFQNEQLLEELTSLAHFKSNNNKDYAKLSNKTDEKSEVTSTNQVIQDQNKSKKTIDPINKFITKISAITSVNDVIDCFIHSLFELINRPIIYLKYVPSHTSLLVTHVAGLDINKFKNAGILFKEEPQSYLKKIKCPQNFQQLQEFMLHVFQVKSYFPLPIIIDKNILGLIIIFDNLADKPQYSDVIDSYLHTFKGFLEKTYFQERMQSLIVSDLYTGAYNKKYFMKILDQEMSRAFRIQHPLSLLYIDIDDFDVYIKRNGEQIGYILLKMIAHICIKTSRKTDWIARWHGGEFAIILPHTDKERAMIKAERLRRTILNAKFPYSNEQPLGYISISAGISEYPSICWDTTSLIQVADNALYQVKKSTKNRICLGVAPKGFQPDFKVISSPLIES